MTTPTHTHRTQGGRLAKLGTGIGEGRFAGREIVIYQDLDTQVPHVVIREEWEANWCEIKPDTCQVCWGTGTDQIKRRKDRPCGGCYGLGRVKGDGEIPKELWELAEVAGRIVGELRRELGQTKRQLAVPGVSEAVEAHRASQADAIAEQEQQWRAGRGYGPGGSRHTGD